MPTSPERSLTRPESKQTSTPHLMSNTVISIDKLAKLYRLGAGPDGKGDFRDVVRSAAAQAKQRVWPRRGATSASRPQASVRELWALRDVSFEVTQGEVFGVIGHNGAGKSTLLKILSRITDPTSGEAWFDGRVGSLLEVGTGFHPELSGRENIYLNGAILGMTRREIERKFEEITEFSEIGQFLDTPVKRYSSGMYVRLAFSVAAHLEPEILIVDEVLSVGDARFQRKCLEKIKEVSYSGRTILFVSHNMGAIQSLCDRVVVLCGGRVVGAGPPLDAVKLYLESTVDKGNLDIAQRTDRQGRGGARVIGATAFSEGHADAPGLLLYGRTAKFQFEISDVPPDLVCKFTIHDYLRRPLCRFTTRSVTQADCVTEGQSITCEVPDLPLVPGQYHLNVSIFSGSDLEDRVQAALTFDVETGTLDDRALAPEQMSVVFAPRHRWTLPCA